MIAMPKIDTPVNRDRDIAQMSNSQIDQNMKDQLNQYQNALMSGDIDLAYTFFYSKAMDYLKSEFPNENIDENYIKEKVLKLGYEMIKSMNEKANTNFKYLVKDVACRYSQNNILIYLINTSLDGTVNGVNRTVPTKTVGISEDKGKSWKFLTQDEETKPMLTKEFGLEMANRIMNCN